MKNFFKKTKSLFWGDDKMKNRSPLFIVLTALSAVALITANILAGKSFSIFNWQIGGAQLVLTCAVLVFPITYILSDLFSEVYGYSASRRVTWLSFILNLFLIVFVCLGIVINGANPYYENVVSDGLVNGLGLNFLQGGNGLGSLGILIASFTAFIFGSWIDDLVFEVIRKKSKNNQTTKSFMFRAVISSFAGEVIDSLIFIPLLYLFTNAFGTTITNFGQLMVIILIQATIKVIYEIIVSPFTAILARKIKKYELNSNNEIKSED